MTTTTDLIDCHREWTRDYIAAARALTADRANSQAKTRFSNMRETMNELAQALFQHRPEAKSDQIVWAAYMLNGMTFVLIYEDNVAMFRDARCRAEVMLGN